MTCVYTAAETVSISCEISRTSSALFSDVIYIIELDEILELPGSGLHSADNQLQLIADIHIRLRQRPERLLQYGDAVVHGG